MPHQALVLEATRALIAALKNFFYYLGLYPPEETTDYIFSKIREEEFGAEPDVERLVSTIFSLVFMYVDKDGSGLFESEDERLAANLDKVLADLPAGGLGDNAIAEVADFASTGLELDVTIKHKPEADFDEKANPEKVLVLTGAAAPAAKSSGRTPTSRR